jgi:hypothetical protein
MSRNPRTFRSNRSLNACKTDRPRMAWRLHCAGPCRAPAWNMRRVALKRRCYTASLHKSSKHSCEDGRTRSGASRISSKTNFDPSWTAGCWRADFYVSGVKVAVTTGFCLSVASGGFGVRRVQAGGWQTRRRTLSIVYFQSFPYVSGSSRCLFRFGIV